MSIVEVLSFSVFASGAESFLMRLHQRRKSFILNNAIFSGWFGLIRAAR